MRVEFLRSGQSVLIAALLAAAALFATWRGAEAQDGAAAAPAPESVAAPKSEEELDGAFEAGVAKLEVEYRRRWEELQRARVAGLESLINQAVARKQSDVAVELREKAAAIEAEIAARSAEESGEKRANDAAGLYRLLKGTTWQWGTKETLRFEPNGLCGNAAWEGPGLVTSWEVIDRRTVLLYIVSGRKDNRYAILSFDANVQSFTQHDFLGSPYNPQARIQRVKRR